MRWAELRYGFRYAHFLRAVWMNRSAFRLVWGRYGRVRTCRISKPVQAAGEAMRDVTTPVVCHHAFHPHGPEAKLQFIVRATRNPHKLLSTG